MNDGRDKVRADEPTARRIMVICNMSGRRAADVRAEALRIGAEVLELKYKESDVVVEPSGLSMDEATPRKPNRQERRAAAPKARKAKPAKTNCGHAVCAKRKKKVSTLA